MVLMHHEIHEFLAPKLLVNILGSRPKKILPCNYLCVLNGGLHIPRNNQVLKNLLTPNAGEKKKKYRVKPVIDRNLYSNNTTI